MRAKGVSLNEEPKKNEVEEENNVHAVDLEENEMGNNEANEIDNVIFNNDAVPNHIDIIDFNDDEENLGIIENENVNNPAEVLLN